MPRFAQIEPTISRLLSHPSRGGILDTDSIARAVYRPRT
jgi:hypothetical protein